MPGRGIGGPVRPEALTVAIRPDGGKNHQIAAEAAQFPGAMHGAVAGVDMPSGAHALSLSSPALFREAGYSVTLLECW
jgi:hypothetical protein